ncbi:MAG: UDP-2,3-diacylglucosamine diphosphatase [Candidatus Latescibacterota bacterium]
MEDGTSYIISDLHLGSEFFRREAFLGWLEQLPEGARLVLNGDVVDDPRKALPVAHVEVVGRLVEESRRRPVVWVYGNHDRTFCLPDPGQIRFVDQWRIGNRLLVVHGDNLDAVMPRHWLFKWVFRRLHALLTRLGLRPMHVAEYAKRWGFLYRVLNQHVARNALAAARVSGFESIVCGHTHAPMDVRRNGHRYLNTGAWTEEPLHYLKVGATDIELKVFEAQRG